MSAAFGDPRLPGRFWSKVQLDDNGCWTWTASLFPSGYGSYGSDLRGTRAHRVAYIALVGPVLDGLVLDHLCRVRHCVNPAHLEAVTIAENSARGDVPWVRRMRSGYCDRGHERTPENLNSRGECRLCVNRRQREYHHRKAAADPNYRAAEAARVREYSQRKRAG